MIGQSEQKPVWHTHENATSEVKLALFPPDDSSEIPGFLTRKLLHLVSKLSVDLLSNWKYNAYIYLNEQPA